MDKAEIQQIADFLIEVREDICEGEGDAAKGVIDSRSLALAFLGLFSMTVLYPGT